MQEKPEILLIDDEVPITENLAPFLMRSGFSVVTAHNGIDALRLLETIQPDLIVTDVLMPEMDGRELLRTLRQRGNWVPVILLTQVGESTERAMALEEGADDYLNKPFDPHELVARLKAILRRTKPGKPSLAASWKLTSLSLTLDRRSRRLWFDQNEIPLTPKAFLLLEYLMTHPDELVSRDRLLDIVWGWDYPVGRRAVDTRIAELRKALHDDIDHPHYIETLPGQGYRYIAPVEIIS